MKFNGTLAYYYINYGELGIVTYFGNSTNVTSFNELTVFNKYYNNYQTIKPNQTAVVYIFTTVDVDQTYTLCYEKAVGSLAISFVLLFSLFLILF